MALVGTKPTHIDQLPLVLQLDVSGNPGRWITFQDSCYYYSKELVAWSMGSIDLTIFGGTSSLTGKQSELTMNTIIAIKGKINEKQFNRISRVPLTNRTLFRGDHQICGYCGRHYKVSELTRDHIIPQSRNGKNTWMNLVTACQPCNKHKADRTPDQANMPLLYVPYAPSRSEYLILQNRRILADQMEFLMKQVPKESRLYNLQRT